MLDEPTARELELEAEVERLREQLEATDRESDADERDLNEYRAENERLRAQYEGALRDQDSQDARHDAEVEQLQERFDALMKSHFAQTEARVAADNEVERLRATKNEFREEVMELRTEIERLREELGRILYRAKDLSEAEEIARRALEGSSDPGRPIPMDVVTAREVRRYDERRALERSSDE